MEKDYGSRITYTDVSKTEHRVGAASVMGKIARRISLPVGASIMTAELYAIRV